jgi:cytochrome b subunit of formate dehydrogenase
VIIGLMVLHWLIDLIRHLVNIATQRPQVRRMRADEVAQHGFLAVSFIALVVSGFALVYDQGWIARLFFGWEGGFEVRGVVHRASAVLFMLTVTWHILFLFTPRGRKYFKDMLPIERDFRFFVRRILYNLGLGRRMECTQRFNYVEKAEYWALVWGTAVMVVTGLLLWFDNWFIQFLPKGILDVALVIHFWEAWLATLAIFIWHFYSVIFHPHVYPMNPSWLTGTVPEYMYEHEHPGHLEEAKRDYEEAIARQMERMRQREIDPEFVSEVESENAEARRETPSSSPTEESDDS